MKTIFTLLLLVSFSFSASSQILKPVKWEYEVVALNDNVFEVHFKAKMDNKWAIYSQHTSDDGPIPTSFTFQDNQAFELKEGVNEVGDLLSGYDELFETNVKKFKKSVDFVQTLKLKKDSATLDGFITFMTCDDKRCLPPTDEEFSIPIK